MADAAVAEKPVVEADVKGKPADARPVDIPAKEPAAKPDAAPATEKPAAEKPATEQPETPAAESGSKADATASKAPEKYTLKVPEGSRVDADDLAEIEQMAKTAGWSNERAQEVVDEQHERANTKAERIAAQWLADTKADREYGGEHLGESERFAKLLINRIRPEGHSRRDSFLRFLNETGGGNHIDVLSFFADIGKAMSEDAPARGGVTGGGAVKGLAERLYPTAAVSRPDDLYGGS